MSDGFAEHKLSILGAIETLNDNVGRLNAASQAQYVEVQRELASIKSKLETHNADRPVLDNLMREHTSVALEVRALKEARVDFEARIRLVESTRSQALLVAAIGSLVMGALIAALFRGFPAAPASAPTHRSSDPASRSVPLAFWWV